MAEAVETLSGLAAQYPQLTGTVLPAHQVPSRYEDQNCTGLGASQGDPF